MGSAQNVDLSVVRACLGRSLQLFDRSYSSSAPGAGGWYHRLESQDPGPSATAVVLHAYALLNRLPTQTSEAMCFLKERQVNSADPLLDGGWSVNTSAGKPMLESTALVVRLLTSGQFVTRTNGPDVARALRWVVQNRNSDGGWGSFQGQQSRVWLTAMAVRALSEADPTQKCLGDGVQWLLRARDPSTGAWGELPRTSGTLTHTAFVLTSLVRSGEGSRRSDVAAAIETGYRWLHQNLDPNTLVDDQARVESYNISHNSDHGTSTWQNSIWHPSLPFALSALVVSPEGSPSALIGAAVNKIVAAQLPTGHWPNVDGSAGVSVWSVWPYVDALMEWLAGSHLASAGRVIWVGDDTMIVSRSQDSSLPTLRLACRLVSAGLLRFLKRQWATLVLVVILTVGLISWLVGRLGFSELLLALILPIVLLVLQELMVRRR